MAEERTGAGGPDGGLEGVVAASTRISSILDGVLTYAGYRIDDLAAHATFEETVYLLWHLDLPDRSQLQALRRDLDDAAPLPAGVVDVLRRLPPAAAPMDVLRTAVSLLALYDGEAGTVTPEAGRRKAARLVARVPVLVATHHRLRSGREPVPPVPGRGIAWNLLAMLHGAEPAPAEARAMDRALVLHADHELNASTFAARVAAATLSDLYAAVTAALAALQGPLHGGAAAQVLDVMEEAGTADRAGRWLAEALAAGRRIPGFGHRVYRTGDPRARHLREAARELAALRGEERRLELWLRLEELVRERTGLFPNVDYYAALVYRLLGVPRDLFAPVFAVARTAGWTAHVLEQHANNRLIRPRAEYRGPGERPWRPLAER